MLVHSCFISDNIADVVATCTWYGYFCIGGSSPARLLSKDESFSSSYSSSGNSSVASLYRPHRASH